MEIKFYVYAVMSGIALNFACKGAGSNKKVLEGGNRYEKENTCPDPVRSLVSVCSLVRLYG